MASDSKICITTQSLEEAKYAYAEIQKNIRDATPALWSWDKETHERALCTARQILAAVKSFIEGLEEILPQAHCKEVGRLQFYSQPEESWPDDDLTFYRNAFIQVGGFLRVAIQSIERRERQQRIQPDHDFQVKIKPIRI